MSIPSTSIWAILLLTYSFGYTLPLAIRRRHPSSKTLPQDPETNCEVWKEGDLYTFAGCSCKELPKNYPMDSWNLEIKLTQLTTLNPGVFENYTHLKSLTIRMNAELHFIIPKAFEGMINLINLDISDNIQLQYLDKDVFTGLNNLKSLRLLKNSLSNFYSLSQAVRPEILPQLVYLDVSENSLGAINATAASYLDGSTIQTLRMSYCGLDAVDSNAFNNIFNLTALYIDNNNMKTETVRSLVINLASNSPNFTELHIGSNYFSDPNIILTSIAATNISIVDISNSHILTLNTMFIPPSPSIRYLDFSGTLMSNFEGNYFTTEKLPNVEYLYLAHNHLLGRNFTINLPKLKVLDLSDNCNVINCAHIIESGRFLSNHSPCLETLKLTSNSIYLITTTLLQGLFKLKELRLSNASIQRIEIGAFSDLHELEILDLSTNILSRNIEINNMTFKGLRNLKTLHLDQSGLTCLEDSGTFQHTPLLEVLTLKQNSFLELHHTILVPLKELNFLDLSQNAFQNWNERIFQGNPSLTHVDLSYNQISAFSRAMLKDMEGLVTLDLTENSLSCVCSDISIIFSYLNSTPDNNQTGALMTALSSSKAYCSSPEQTRFTPYLQYVADMRSEAECLIYNEMMTIITICILGIGLFFLVTVPTIYFLRWHIKYWLFLLRQAMTCYIFPKKKHPEPEGKYAYDAFVSYSNEDRGFVVRLVSMLESHSPHFSLCVYERDFNVGGMITDNVVDCLSKSRRTILVLSDSFAKSTWCQWEMNLAQHKRLFFKDDHHGPLIIIKIGEIMEKHMTPTLRYLIKTRIYLQWNSDPIKQKVFWEKLRSALAAPLDEGDGRPSLQHSVITNGDTVNNNNITMSLNGYSNESCDV